MDWLIPLMLTVITASTPLLLASTGELITEKSGVLNLGVEGMMLVGAISGFAVTASSGSAILGVLAAIVAGMLMSLIFAFLTLTLMANQVATGLALTIFGVGFSALVGSGFVGFAIEPLPGLHIPVLTDIPLVGEILFGQDFLVYLSIVMVIAVGFFLSRTRGGLILKAVGDSHHSAHAIGYSVIKIRNGGACRGVSVTVIYTDVGRKHDRGPWLDRIGTCGVCNVASGAIVGRGLYVRAYFGIAASCAKCGCSCPVTIHVDVALPCDRDCSGDHFQ
jgi:ABC-type uncharacterized transport system permease subunit